MLSKSWLWPLCTHSSCLFTPWTKSWNSFWNLRAEKTQLWPWKLLSLILFTDTVFGNGRTPDYLLLGNMVYTVSAPTVNLSAVKQIMFFCQVLSSCFWLLISSNFILFTSQCMWHKWRLWYMSCTYYSDTEKTAEIYLCNSSLNSLWWSRFVLKPALRPHPGPW